MSERHCFYTGMDYFDHDSGQYPVVRITERQAGYEQVEDARTLGEAWETANRLNAGLGLSSSDVAAIVASSKLPRLDSNQQPTP